MSFFRFRSKIVNQLRQPTGRNLRAQISLQTSNAEPAMFFDSPTRQASVNDLPIPAPTRVRVQPAARFPTMQRIMARTILNRGKA